MKALTKYDTILVPVHFTTRDSTIAVAPDSKEAVSQAFELAAELKSQLTFAHVFAGREDPGASSDDGDLPLIRYELDKIVAEATRAGITARWVFLFGHPSEEICSLAVSEGFDLVLLGTRRIPGEGASLVGSTAAQVTLECAVPTWIAKRPSTDLSGIVVATDLSPSGGNVLRHGTKLARWRSADLHIVNACEQLAPASEQEFEHEMQLRRARLEALMADVVRDAPVPNFTSHVEIGSPESVIWSVARQEKADVVVVGLRNHDATERLLRAHTAEQVLFELPCSLLTVRLDVENGNGR